MTRNKKIAITGGIGSGKSEVAKKIRDSGYRVYSCDDIYGEMLLDGVFTEELVSEFGTGILTDEGVVSRRKISEMVFGDEEKLKWLTDLTNPQVIRETLFRMGDVSMSLDGEIVFSEVPILFENGYEKFFDDVIVVIRDYSDRLECVKKRYGLDEESAHRRISCQIDYEGKTFDGYEVIFNVGTVEELRKKTEKTIEKIKLKK